MKLFYEDKSVKIYHGDILEASPSDCWADLILTDPPWYWHLWDLKMQKLSGRRLIISRDHKWPQPDWTVAWVAPEAVLQMSPWGQSHWQNVLCYGQDPHLGCDKVTDAYVEVRPLRDTRPKPLMMWTALLMRGSRYVKDTVLDPFCGSGTCLLAAKLIGRKSIGIDIDEAKCEEAANLVSGRVFREQRVQAS